MTENITNALDIESYGREREDDATSDEASLGSSRHAPTEEVSALPEDSEAMTEASTRASRVFDAKASIVLVGLRGTGKSSLAVMVSTICNLRLVEIDWHFRKVTGHSLNAHRKAFGVSAHHEALLEVLQAVLSTCQRGCVIVCNPVSMGRGAQAMIQDYMKSHPVIHVVRDIQSLHRYLPGRSRARIEHLMDIGGSALRACSNFEFYNLTGDISADPMEDVEGLSQCRRLATEDLEMACDLFEISVNNISSSVDNEAASASRLNEFGRALTIVRRNTVVPVMYHVQFGGITAHSDDDGLTRQQYRSLVSHCLRLGPEYVTVDLLLDDEVILQLNEEKGRSKLLGHFTFASRPSSGWEDSQCLMLFERVCKLGLDACRINMPADRIEDNFAVQTFRQRASAIQPDVALIAYNTGPIGRMSLCFNSTLTPVRPEDLGLSAPPSLSALTARECTRSLYASFVLEPMKFYIIGAAIAYTLSPAMHNAAYKSCGMPHNFLVWQTETLDVIQQMVNDDHFGGTAVNPPFKTEVIALTHSLSPHAKAIGAVNTLIPVRRSVSVAGHLSGLSLLEERNHAGTVKFLHGDNTDWIGVRTCIRRGLSPINAVGPRTTALVVGAGGMARATVYAMIQLHIQHIFLYNRTATNAEKLAAHYNGSGFHALAPSAGSGMSCNEGRQHGRSVVRVIESLADPWPASFQQPTIVVSCIPAHDIAGNPAANFTMPGQWLQSPTGGVVVEMAYKPLATPLLEQIAAEAHRGWVTVDGLELLPEQAFAQFELFTGRRAPRKLMRIEALRTYWDAQKSDSGVTQNPAQAQGQGTEYPLRD
ncbi:MAG: hypothetical protein Q9165_006437 [Trypethelium subeluteriae]